jgi:hypothetical protein
LANQGHAKEALVKYDEALKYAPNWAVLKEARDLIGFPDTGHSRVAAVNTRSSGRPATFRNNPPTRLRINPRPALRRKRAGRVLLLTTHKIGQ